MKCDNTRNGVTIGIPVFNEELFVEAAVRSAAPQCEKLLISDNGSTDRSVIICTALAEEYPNIEFVRQQRNLGAMDNFKFLLDRAETPYFMWLGAHDLIPANYVESLLNSLNSDPTAVLAYGNVSYVDRTGNAAGEYEYFFNPVLAHSHARVRFLGLVRYVHDCSLIYGLFRRNALFAAWADVKCLGSDLLILGNAVLLGRFQYVQTTSFIRRYVRTMDSGTAQLQRIAGPTADTQNASYSEMQRRQFGTALAVTNLGWCRKLKFVFAVRLWLVARFGRFGSGGAGRTFDELLLLLLLVRNSWVHRKPKTCR